MTFTIPTELGNVPYISGGHSRKELAYAFKRLRKSGHGKDSILLSAIFGELFPKTWNRLHSRWLEKNGF